MYLCIVLLKEKLPYKVYVNQPLTNILVTSFNFFTYLPESQIKNKFLFIQANFFIIFTCPNPVLLCNNYPGNICQSINMAAFVMSSVFLLIFHSYL